MTAALERHIGFVKPFSANPFLNYQWMPFHMPMKLLKDVETPAEAKGVTTTLGSRNKESSRKQQSGALERYDL